MLSSFLVRKPVSAAGIDIATFGILRDRLASTHGPAPPAGLLMAAGMLSSTTAQLVAYPLGLVRTRLQVRRRQKRRFTLGFSITEYKSQSFSKHRALELIACATSDAADACVPPFTPAELDGARPCGPRCVGCTSTHRTAPLCKTQP